LSDLQTLEQKIKEKLEAAEQRKQLQRQYQTKCMLEYERRHQRFNAIADRLMRSTVRPRMEKLAAHFDNVHFPDPKEAARHHDVCCFQRTMEFLATAKLELAVSHDGVYQELLLLYNVEIVPVLFPFEGRDELAMPLDSVDEQRVASWFDEKILCFVDIYLRLGTLESWESPGLVGSQTSPFGSVMREHSMKELGRLGTPDGHSPADESYCLKEASLELP
jgi:hypothetical protein